MDRTTTRWPVVFAAALAFAAMVPTAVRAANTCNAFVAIGYETTQNFLFVGDTLRVILTVGTGSIAGGTKATFRRVRFDLDCDSGSPLGLGCVDDGAVVQYLGDGTIATDCPATFATGHAVDVLPNQVVFTPNAPFDAAAAQPEFCALSFGVRIASRSTDPTPDRIEQVAGYSAAGQDVVCDNGLASSGSQAGAVPLCPLCDDGDVCTEDRCDPLTGQCTNTDICGGGEGCTPGYWKQRHHFGSWTAPYTPSTQFSMVFDNAFPGKTLLQVLQQGGGGLVALGRHTVAALLNAASSGVSFDLTPGDVVAQFNAVFPGGNYGALKNRFEGFNEQTCPLGRNP